MTRQQMPILAALFGYVVLMVGGVVLQRFPMGGQVAWMVLYEGGLMLAFPVAMIMLSRVPLHNGLRLHRVPVMHLLWFAAASVVFCLFYFHLTLFASRFLRPMHRMVESERYFIEMSVQQVGLLGIAVATMGVVICEETFFRGFFLGSFEGRMRALWVCLIIGVLFSVMHLDRGKLIPIIFAGAWFTYVALRGGSIWPGMVAHYVLNMLAVYLANMSDEIPRETYRMFRYPSALWFLATVPAMAGVVLLTELMYRPKRAAAPEMPVTLPSHS
jgi:membrane protease YdiL (CAAX protease family)